MRLLLAEDDLQLGHSLSRGLRENSYAVDLVVDGEEAVQRAGSTEYDAIVLDIMLPKLDGLSVARTLRAHGMATPILMLTARDAIADRVEGLDAGADDYLVKPFAFDELLARLRAITRRVSPIRESILTVGTLTIDTRRQRVSKGDRSIPLTAKEYALLEFFARHEGTLITRAFLTAHVWDESHVAGSNTAEVFINRLRRKIDDPLHASFIRTKRGAGYVFTAPNNLDTDRGTDG